MRLKQGHNMIFNVFFAAISTLIQTVFGILPDLPDMPVGITNALETVRDFILYGVSVLGSLLGWTFLLIVLPILIVLANFNWIYHLVLWILKKLPIGVK